MIPEEIRSGGQTGVDRAALDMALHLGIPCGGWCPRGRLAEDGPLDVHYPLQETPSRKYPQRTLWNIRDSDATLILNSGPIDGGTELTIRLACRLGRPHLVVDLREANDVSTILNWLQMHGVKTLNIAGPRESKSPGIYAEAREFLNRLLTLE